MCGKFYGAGCCNGVLNVVGSTSGAKDRAVDSQCPCSWRAAAGMGRLRQPLVAVGYSTHGTVHKWVKFAWEFRCGGVFGQMVAE